MINKIHVFVLGVFQGFWFCCVVLCCVASISLLREEDGLSGGALEGGPNEPYQQNFVFRFTACDERVCRIICFDTEVAPCCTGVN